MTDAHCHVSGGDPTVREFIVGRDFFGVHPWNCQEFSVDWLRGELNEHPEAGVGEIGLDRLKEREISPFMREVFAAQLALAFELGRPAVLHGAKCWGQVVEEVKRKKEEGKRENTTVDLDLRPRPLLFHGFSRSDGLIPDIVALNGYISVGPAVLNDHAVNYRELVKKIPLDRLLVETDRDCAVEALINPLTGAPLTIRDVLAKTAEIRGIPADELECVTDENATRFASGGTA